MGSVCALLLRVSWRVGAAHGKHALLQARQLGITSCSAALPESVKEALLAYAAEQQPPKHWDPSVMPGPEPEGWMAPGTAAGRVQLCGADIQALQAMLDASFCVKRRHKSDRAVVPSGLELASGVRLQSWRAWVSFSAKQEAIRAQLQGTDLGDTFLGYARLKTAGHNPLGIELDEEANCVWLFHHVSAKTADAAAAAGDLSAEGANGRKSGRTYGWGVYLAESCAATDMLAAESVDGMRCLMLCRVALGNVFYDDAILPDVARLVSECTSGRYNSVLGDREKHWPNSAYREFVVYDMDQVYPEFLLWYKRVYR